MQPMTAENAPPGTSPYPGNPAESKARVPFSGLRLRPRLRRLLRKFRQYG